jgi:hypothetical protein
MTVLITALAALHILPRRESGVRVEQNRVLVEEIEPNSIDVCRQSDESVSHLEVGRLDIVYLSQVVLVCRNVTAGQGAAGSRYDVVHVLRIRHVPNVLQIVVVTAHVGFGSITQHHGHLRTSSTVGVRYNIIHYVSTGSRRSRSHTNDSIFPRAFE